jgi:hypothetical protein
LLFARMLHRGTHSFLAAALIAFAALIGSASAHADVPASGDFSPAIWSDKADYSPGEHVVLSGANWQAGESVHVTVNDDAGSTWNRTVDVTADDAGAITDEFDLPAWFIAQYSVRAEGAAGSVATYDFTDGNVKIHSAGGNDFNFTYTVLTGSTNCVGGTTKSTGTATATVAGTTVPGGVGGSESLRIDAPAHPNAPNAGRLFSNWSSPDPFDVVGGTNN